MQPFDFGNINLDILLTDVTPNDESVCDDNVNNTLLLDTPPLPSTNDPLQSENAPSLFPYVIDVPDFENYDYQLHGNFEESEVVVLEEISDRSPASKINIFCIIPRFKSNSFVADFDSVIDSSVRDKDNEMTKLYDENSTESSKSSGKH